MYVKWVLILVMNTPTYIVLEEAIRGEKWVEAGRRAVSFAEKNRTRSDKIILTMCEGNRNERKAEKKENH